MNLTWLKVKQPEKDPTCHPLSGSSEHYSLYDRFHEYNTKDQKDGLRRVNLVPELSGWLNTQTAEQLFAGMRKNNYFMNMLTPSAHVFLMRSIIHHYNKSKNESVKESVSPNEQLTLNGNGHIVVGTISLITMFLLIVRALLDPNASNLIPSKGTHSESIQIDERPSGDKKRNHDQCTHVNFFKYVM